MRIFSRPRPTLVETSIQCIQQRFLLRAGPILNARAIGVLAKAQALYDVEIHGVVVMSSHVHVLATYRDPEQMAAFHCFWVGNLSKAVKEIHDWDAPVFPERYRHVEISDEPEMQWMRLCYLLAQGCKEGLVASPLDWPGASSTWSLTSGEPLMGEWVDRTALREAMDRGENVTEEDFVEGLELKLSPIPSLAHLSPESYRLRLLELVGDIEEETAARHAADGTRPAGPKAVLGQNPIRRAKGGEKRPRPWFHGLRKEVREAMRTALVYITVAYREAAERLKAGDRHARFPIHTFPPGLPFVREVEVLEPG